MSTLFRLFLAMALLATLGGCSYEKTVPTETAEAESDAVVMALPTEDDSVFVLAEGELPIGEYQRIRINVGEALIWFATDQSKGQAAFPANPDPDVDEGYPVTVPSGRLNTNVGLTVEDDGTGIAVPVSLVFDPNMTFKNVHTTGSGKIILTPQFRMP